MTDVRLVGPADWAALRQIRRRIEDGPWWLAEDAGRPVGLVAVHPADGDERHLVAMWVAPEFRGTPVATELVETVCSWAADAGASTLALRVVDGNDRARRFYERLGFVPTGERRPLPSNPAVGQELMRRPLRA